jgi:hypothetical protein
MGNTYLELAHRLGREAALAKFGQFTGGMPGNPPPTPMPAPGGGGGGATPMPVPPGGIGATPAPINPGGTAPTPMTRTAAARGAGDFARWMQEAPYDNPTAPPPKFAGFSVDTDGIVRRTLEKLGEPRGQKVKPGSRVGGKSEPASRAPLGAGGRFQALKRKLSHKKGVRNPGALAAAIGRSAHGAKGMGRLSAKGRKG